MDYDGDGSPREKQVEKKKVDDYSMLELMERGRCTACTEWSVRGWNIVPFKTIPCGHQICANCIEDLFRQNENKTAQCEVCQTKFRNYELTDKTKDEMLLERACRVRKEVTNVFNKTEHDFGTIEEYHKYQEKVEKIIDCKLQGIEEGWVEQEMKRNETFNQGITARNRSNQIQRMSGWGRQVLAEQLDYLIVMRKFFAEDAAAYKRMTEDEKDEWEELGINDIRKALVEDSERYRKKIEENGFVLPKLSTFQAAVAKAEGVPKKGMQNGRGATQLSAAERVHKLKQLPHRHRVVAKPQPGPMDGSKKLPQKRAAKSTEERAKQRRAGGFDVKLVKSRTKHEMFSGVFKAG